MADSVEDRPPTTAAPCEVVLDGGAGHGAADDALHGEMDLDEAEVTFGFSKRADHGIAHRRKLPCLLS
jgi:hypothetical protein